MKHGGDIYTIAKKLKCSPKEIVDFSSNINAYHPKTDITLTNSMLVPYSDTSYKELKNIIAKKHHLKRSQISLFNGATSAIFELFKTLKPKDVYLYAPLYGEYEKAAKLNKKHIYTINRLSNLYTKPKKRSIVVFVNPSTPDGKYYSLKKLFAIWKKQKCIVILDESFLEFQSLKSWRKQINSYNKLYIVNSFTKFYACAGVRIGALYSNKKNIKKLHTPLWNLSSFDVAFLSSRLQDTKFEKKSKKLHISNKKELLNILKSAQLFSRIYKSDTNFFLVRSPQAKKIYKYLLKEKILLRRCESFDFLTQNYLRFAVKDTLSHKKLERALKKFSSKQPIQKGILKNELT